MTVHDEVMSNTVDRDTADLMPYALNPDPRCAAVLVLDRSGSMEVEDAIGKLNAGLRVLKEELSNDELAAKRIELGIVSYGGDVTIDAEIGALDDFEPMELQASSNTPLAEAMDTALNMVKRQIGTYKEAGIAYYKPWILLITDGLPTDPVEEVDDVVNALQESQQKGMVTVFAVGVDQADFKTLDRMTYKFAPKKLSNVKWSEFFIWLSVSLKKISASNPDEKVKLDKADEWEA